MINLSGNGSTTTMHIVLLISVLKVCMCLCLCVCVWATPYSSRSIFKLTPAACVKWCSCLGTWMSVSMWCVINIVFLLVWDADVGCCCCRGVQMFTLTSRLLRPCVFFSFLAGRSWQRKWWALRFLSQGNVPDFSAHTRKAQTKCQNWTSHMERRMPLSWRCVSIKIKTFICYGFCGQV